MKKRVAVLISGRGSNMRSLVEASRASDYPAEIVLVASNRPDAAGVADREDAQSTREGFFGAVRTWFEAIAQGQLLVLAWEDIHWADEGMLDLIEYLSQWLRAPVLQVCLARDELLERRPGWGASRRTTTSPRRRSPKQKSREPRLPRCLSTTGAPRISGGNSKPLVAARA